MDHGSRHLRRPRRGPFGAWTNKGGNYWEWANKLNPIAELPPRLPDDMPF